MKLADWLQIFTPPDLPVFLDWLKDNYSLSNDQTKLLDLIVLYKTPFQLRNFPPRWYSSEFITQDTKNRIPKYLWDKLNHYQKEDIPYAWKNYQSTDHAVIDAIFSITKLDAQEVTDSINSVLYDIKNYPEDYPYPIRKEILYQLQLKENLCKEKYDT